MGREVDKNYDQDTFGEKLETKTLEIWKAKPNLVYAIVGINSRQQETFKIDMAKHKRLELKAEHNEGEIEYISTKVQDVDILYVVAPNEYKCLKMFHRGATMVAAYRNGSSFRNRALQDVRCVDASGSLRRIGEYALIKVCGCDKLNDEEKRYLTDDVCIRLNLISRQSADGETITFYGVPQFKPMQKSDSRNAYITAFCKEKKARLSLALSNFLSVYELDVRGGDAKKVHCLRQYGKYSNEKLLDTAVNAEIKAGKEVFRR